MFMVTASLAAWIAREPRYASLFLLHAALRAARSAEAVAALQAEIARREHDHE